MNSGKAYQLKYNSYENNLQFAKKPNLGVIGKIDITIIQFLLKRLEEA